MSTMAISVIMIIAMIIMREAIMPALTRPIFFRF